MRGPEIYGGRPIIPFNRLYGAGPEHFLTEVISKIGPMHELDRMHLHVPDLTGIGVGVTGATGDGIGFATAKLFAERGALVYVFGRSEAKTTDAIARIQASAPHALLTPVIADLESEADLEYAIKQIQDHQWPLHILVNNAGVLPGKNNPRVPGQIDVSMAVGCVAAFVLSVGLLEKINAAPEDSLIVKTIANLASTSHYSVDIPDSGIYHTETNPWKRYGFANLSKLTLTMREVVPRLAQRTYEGTNTITNNMVEPGLVKTEIMGGDLFTALEGIAVRLALMYSPQQAAKGIVMAVLPPFSEANGVYIELGQFRQARPGTQAQADLLLGQIVREIYQNVNLRDTLGWGLSQLGL